MKVCLVHNSYGKFSGEEAVVEGQQKLLQENGHEVCMFKRSSEEIPHVFMGQLRAFLSGVYNPFSRHAFKKFLQREKPDVIHAHNLYPLLSPSILPIATKLGIPVVMTVHNYRLVCPSGLHYSHGEICTKCEGGREYWCVVRNCENSISKSLGYALRNWWSRKRRYYLDNVTGFACLTSFQRDSLIRAGINSNKIDVIPNMVETPEKPTTYVEPEHVGYIGRLSHEKGIDTLVNVARSNSDIKFSAAGSYASMGDLDRRVPDNFTLLGHCSASELGEFYDSARFIVLPSECFEGFPMVLLEAMLMQKAVICSNIGGLSDIVDDGITGLLSRPADADDLAQKIRILWDDPELCHKMGKAGHEKVLREYSQNRHYERLIDIYMKAITK